jgi:hypothetical protein
METRGSRCCCGWPRRKRRTEPQRKDRADDPAMHAFGRPLPAGLRGSDGIRIRVIHRSTPDHLHR